MFINNPVEDDYNDLLKWVVGGSEPMSIKHEEAKIKIQLKSTIDIYNKLHNLVESLNGLPGKIGHITNRMIESNERLAKSNEKYLFWQNILTGALVLATIGLIIATLLLSIAK